MLAAGGDDMKVHLYAENDSGELEHKDALQGHEDWVRSLDFTTTINADGAKCACVSCALR